MSKRYLDTSFSDFIRHKLYEVAKSEKQEPQNKEEAPEKEQPDNEQPIEETDMAEDKKKKHKVGSKEYMDDFKKEFEEIITNYDNLYGAKQRGKLL